MARVFIYPIVRMLLLQKTQSPTDSADLCLRAATMHLLQIIIFHLTQALALAYIKVRIIISTTIHSILMCVVTVIKNIDEDKTAPLF